MNTRLAFPVPALLGALFLAAGPLLAQSEPDKPARGKIDGVEREARRGDGDGIVVDGDGDEDGVWLVFRVIGSALHALVTPAARPGQGYTRYPYAEPGNPDAFAMEGMATGRSFGNVSGTYFDDRTVGGTLQAGQLSLEGANGMIVSGLEYTLYREPTRSDTDWLHLARVALGAAPRLGRHGIMRVMVGARVIVLDNGESAVGPELELGVQAFPVRPWAVSASARGALVTWNSGLNWRIGGTSPFADLQATGSYFMGPVELQAGWRYTRIGAAPAFSGPVAGVRLWF